MTDPIREKLLSMAEPAYRKFHCKLIPTVSVERVIGIRVPALRSLAKACIKEGSADAFLERLPHRYYEENNLHAFIIEQIIDFDTCVKAVERFLPYIDNWATCDSLRPKCFCKHRQELLRYIERWLLSTHPYTVRFGIEMLMCHYLDGDFSDKYLEKVASVKGGEYYVDMMIAWYFATALAKQWDQAVVYLEQNRLPVWIHNETVQKAIESYRITAEQKEYLRKLRV